MSEAGAGLFYPDSADDEEPEEAAFSGGFALRPVGGGSGE